MRTCPRCGEHHGRLDCPAWGMPWEFADRVVPVTEQKRRYEAIVAAALGGPVHPKFERRARARDRVGATVR